MEIIKVSLITNSGFDREFDLLKSNITPKITKKGEKYFSVEQILSEDFQKLIAYANNRIYSYYMKEHFDAYGNEKKDHICGSCIIGNGFGFKIKRPHQRKPSYYFPKELSGFCQSDCDTTPAVKELTEYFSKIGINLEVRYGKLD